jgi:hypothetical protein
MCDKYLAISKAIQEAKETNDDEFDLQGVDLRIRPLVRPLGDFVVQNT